MTAFEDFVNLEVPRRPALLTVAITSYDGDPNGGGAPAILIGAPVGTFYQQETPETLWRKGVGGTWANASAGGALDLSAVDQDIIPDVDETRSLGKVANAATGALMTFSRSQFAGGVIAWTGGSLWVDGVEHVIGTFFPSGGGLYAGLGSFRTSLQSQLRTAGLSQVAVSDIIANNLTAPFEATFTIQRTRGGADTSLEFTGGTFTGTWLDVPTPDVEVTGTDAGDPKSEWLQNQDLLPAAPGLAIGRAATDSFTPVIRMFHSVGSDDWTTKKFDYTYVFESDDENGIEARLLLPVGHGITLTADIVTEINSQLATQGLGALYEVVAWSALNFAGTTMLYGIDLRPIVPETGYIATTDLSYGSFFDSTSRADPRILPGYTVYDAYGTLIGTTAFGPTYVAGYGAPASAGRPWRALAVNYLEAPKATLVGKYFEAPYNEQPAVVIDNATAGLLSVLTQITDNASAIVERTVDGGDMQLILYAEPSGAGYARINAKADLGGRMAAIIGAYGDGAYADARSTGWGAVVGGSVGAWDDGAHVEAYASSDAAVAHGVPEAGRDAYVRFDAAGAGSEVDGATDDWIEDATALHIASGRGSKAGGVYSAYDVGSDVTSEASGAGAWSHGGGYAEGGFQSLRRASGLVSRVLAYVSAIASDASAVASGIASQVWGVITDGDAVASGDGAIQVGSGTNVEDNSIQVGNGPRIAPAAPAAPKNADIYPTGSDTIVYSGGVARNLSNLELDHNAVVVSASRDFAESDRGKTLVCDSGPIVLTLVTGLSAGWWCIVHDSDGSVTTVNADSGATINVLSKGTVGAGPPKTVSSTGTALDECLVKFVSASAVLVSGDVA